MEKQGKQGRLVIIGGAERKEGDCRVLREFVRCAGGTKAKIAVLTAATRLPGEVGKDYIDVFERLGVEEVFIVDTEYRDEAERPENLEKVKKATGVFFTGGDQARVIEYVKGTKLDQLLHQRHAEGMVIGGTSAGAAIMPDEMIVEGDSQTNPRANTVEMGVGMGFLPGILVDQHFAQRGRLGRLMAALLLKPADLGLGIDEDTAIIVDGDEFHVVGSGSVTIVDESETTYNNLDEILKDEPMVVCGVKLHILSDGFRFNLKTRLPLIEQTPPVPAIAT